MLKVLPLILLLVPCTFVLADEQVRTVTVSGSGTAEVTPDRATVHMSIVAREATIKAAQAKAADVAGRVLELADDMDISRDHVDTTGVSARPDYRWNRESEEPEMRGFIAERQITIRLEDLDRLGELVEGAVDAGVNQVSPPQLDSSKRKAMYRQALQAAAEDARTNAEQLAGALDAGIGQVLSISSGSAAQWPPNPYRAGALMASADAGGSESYNPAEMSVNASVTAVFELTD